MTTQNVGYQLFDQAGTILKSWGGIPNQMPGFPNPLVLPNGSTVYGATGPGFFGSNNEWEVKIWQIDVSPPIPQEVTLAQARAALMGAGLFTQVDTFVKASNNPLAIMAWEYTNMVSRNGKLVEALAPTLGFTDAQLDQLFVAAAAIQL